MNRIIILLSLLLATSFLIYKQTAHKKEMPTIAIANYGPHSSLEEIIIGIKKELASNDFIENETIHYDIADVAFDPSLIMQMLSKLNSARPNLIVAITTPVAQLAKTTIKNTPVIYTGVTDPAEAGLISDNITGCSEQIDLSLMINFAKKLLPQVKTIGVLYSTSEANDTGMLRNLKQAAELQNIEVIAVGIDHPRDISTRINIFKDKVDFIYIGMSGPIQPALPIIANCALKMNIPLINADIQGAKDNLVLASFGVNYIDIGINTGKMILKILKGTNVKDIAPIHPQASQYKSYISAQNAKLLGITIPEDLIKKEAGN